MRRRHRSGGRIMLRGKPGLIIVVVLLLVGTLVAYYTWSGSSSTTTNKTRFSKYGSKTKFQGQRNANQGLRYGGQQMPKGPQMQNPSNMRNKVIMKPLEPPGNIDFQDGPRVDTDEDYKFRPDNGDEEFEKDRDDFKDEDDYAKSDLKEKDEAKEKKFQQSDEKTTMSSGILYPQLYVSPDDKTAEQFRKMEHIVHLDLKGAPPNVNYLISLLPLMKKLGATGLLVEYEDMFPYHDELKILASNDAYSIADITRLLNAAKIDGLKVIPLIQTFGHMEFVLKYSKYLDLREQPDTPQVITPTSLKSYELIQKMIDQIMTIHSDAPYLHIGCDEVYGLGQGKVADLMKSNNLTKEQVFLEHVKKVASSAKSKYPKTTVIMWDDELRTKISSDDIEKAGLGNLVELMVWSYIPHPKDRLNSSIWLKYGKHFSGIWAASSFKGATGSAQFFTNVSYHLENHINWIQIVMDLKDVVPVEKFRGFALTGWQRYDHFAALCELLPSSIPSLAVNLQVVQNGGFNTAIHRTVSKMLNCTSLVDLDFPKKGKEYVNDHDCRFPGSDFYYAIRQLWSTMDKFNSDVGLQSRIQGWLTDYHVKTHFSSPGHMKILQKKLIKILDNLQSLVKPVRDHLRGIYDVNTINEWVMVHLTQKINDLKIKLNMTTMLLQGSKTWDKRPLAPGSSGSQVQPNFNQQQQQQQFQQQQQQQFQQQQQQQFQQQQPQRFQQQQPQKFQQQQPQQFQQQQPQKFQQQQQQQQPGNARFDFKQGNMFGQANNNVQMRGQPKNLQLNPLNSGQPQEQGRQGMQNTILSRQKLGSQDNFGSFKIQNSFGQKGGLGQNAVGSQNTGMKNNIASQGQGNQPNPQYRQLPSFLQQKPFGGLDLQPKKGANLSVNADPNSPGNRHTDNQAAGFPPKRTYGSNYIERQGVMKMKNGADFQANKEGDQKPLENLGFGQRRGDLKDMEQGKKDSQPTEKDHEHHYDEKEDQEKDEERK